MYVYKQDFVSILCDVYRELIYCVDILLLTGYTRNSSQKNNWHYCYMLLKTVFM